NFCIYPFVAYSPVRPVFYPDAKEVAELLETPLRLLFDPTNYKEETWHLQNFGPRRIPFFDVLGHKVWGATAMILSEFVTVVKRNEGRAW
ncbi:MAG: CoA pyrophosphatase, partial [Anaerolineae bacterium]|nr:CoA pyrophosphatase [Anaerolineae bacterium]